MILSFADRDTEALLAGEAPRRIPPEIRARAREKLRRLRDAETLASLATPAGNRLEALRGDRAGQYSIRINDQWRVCFRFIDGNAHDVEIVDYHR